MVGASHILFEPVKEHGVVIVEAALGLVFEPARQSVDLLVTAVRIPLTKGAQLLIRQQKEQNKKINRFPP